MQNSRYYWMLTALFIQHDQGFHAHLVTLQHNNDVTIARQKNAVRSVERRARRELALGPVRPPRAGTTLTQHNSNLTKHKIYIRGGADGADNRTSPLGRQTARAPSYPIK